MEVGMAREKRIESFRALRALWREDLATYHGQISRPGFQALAVHRFGVWKHGVANRLARMPLTATYRLANLVVRNLYGIELLIETRIGRRVYFAHQHGITVAPTAVIGDDCVVHQMATIGHTAGMVGGVAPPAPRLGNRVKVGVGAVVAGGIDIGDDVVIGPNAVVMASVPEGALVTALPSRVMARPPRRKPAAVEPLRETGT
jgi:serine O-acetyltransferase